MDTIKSNKIQLQVDIKDNFGDIRSPEHQEPASPQKEFEELKKDRVSIAAKSKDIDSLLIFTKQVDKPTFQQTIKERRFQMRTIQLLFSIGAFLSLGYTAFQTSYTTVILGNSGISFFVFVNIISIFVSLSNMFLYSFPKFLLIPPHRHPRVSRVELTFDLMLFVSWLVGTTQLATFAKCPSYSKLVNDITRVFEYVDNSTKYCPTLVTTIALGYLTGIAYLLKFVDGLKKTKKSDTKMVGKHIMFARGNWKN